MAVDTEITEFTGCAAVEVRCWCGIAHAIPRTLYNERERQYENGLDLVLYCPLGHTHVKARGSETPAQKEARQLREQLERTNSALASTRNMLDCARNETAIVRRSVSAHKGAITKIKKRVANGTCPCCHATFKNLRDHMSRKHPKWDPERGAEAIAAKE